MVLVEDEVGGERALDTVRNNEPDLVTNLEVRHFTPNLGDHTCSISAQNDREVVPADVGVVFVDEVSQSSAKPLRHLQVHGVERGRLDLYQDLGVSHYGGDLDLLQRDSLLDCCYLLLSETFTNNTRLTFTPT